MGLRLLIICIFVGQFLAACSFENDDRFSPGTKGIFLLTEDSSGVRSISGFDDGQLILNWAANNVKDFKGIPGDMLIRNHQLWFTDPQNERIFAYDLRKKEQKFNFHLAGEGFKPHLIAYGNETLLAADTVSKRFLFMDVVKNGFTGHLIEENFPVNLREIIAANGNFYFREGCCAVSIWNETAVTEINRIDLGDSIYSMFISEFNHIGIYTTQKNSYFASTIHSSADELIKDHIQMVAQLFIAVSPFSFQKYGFEYTGQITLREGRFINPQLPGDSIENFHADFFESRIFYQTQDSTYVADMHELQPGQSWPRQLKILKLQAWTDSIEEEI